MSRFGGFELWSVTLVGILLWVEAVTTLLVGTYVNQAISTSYGFFTYQLLIYSTGWVASLIAAHMTNHVLGGFSEPFYSLRDLSGLVVDGKIEWTGLGLLKPQQLISVNMANTWLQRCLNGILFIGIQLGSAYLLWLALRFVVG